MLSVEVQEDMREAANNLVKHFHKPEQEVCDHNECVPMIQLLTFIKPVGPLRYNKRTNS